MNNSLFSIIIVNWNSSDLLRNCLGSIPHTNPEGRFEIIVVDNASIDNSVKMVKQEFHHVKLIENEQNLGFAKATNLGIKASCGKYILLLNSDAELKTCNTLKKVEQFFELHDEVGILGVNLIFPDGVPQAPGGRFISNWQLFKSQVLFLSSPMFYRMKDKFFSSKMQEFHSIDYVSGASMFVQKKVFDEIGMFDEGFFMYGEDMEFCYRAKQHGWRSVILNTIETIHLKGQSTKKNIDDVLFHGIKNNCLLIKRFYGYKSSLIAHNIYMIGLFFRFITSFFRRDIKPLQYFKVIASNSKFCLPSIKESRR